MAMRMYADLQNQMTSSQRLIEYTDLDLEDELDKPGDVELKGWPQKGEIVFDNITMRYREGLEPSVKNLSFVIQAGMKVGIVGRTGAGKSSILQICLDLQTAVKEL